MYENATPEYYIRAKTVRLHSRARSNYHDSVKTYRKILFESLTADEFDINAPTRSTTSSVSGNYKKFGNKKLQ